MSSNPPIPDPVLGDDREAVQLAIDPREAVQLAIAPDEKLFPVPKVAEMVSGSRPHPVTSCRWCRKGISGVLLPSLIVSGQRMTSLEAYGKWLREVTAKRNAR